MNRKITIYIVLLIVVIGLIIVIDSNKPRPINWEPTYALKDKIPLGLHVFDKEAPKLFNSTIEKFSRTPYEYFEEQYDYENSEYKAQGTFIHIADKSVIDEESARELIYFAEHGNTVFLSMKTFPAVILDTLQIGTGSQYTVKDSIPLYMADKKAGDKKYYFNEGAGIFYFDSISATTKVLGYQDLQQKKMPNFVKVSFGKGSFLLHTQPAAFSNFHLLKGNHHEYTEKVISYINNGNIYWYTENTQPVSGSPLRYIMKQPALKWTVYLGLIGLLIFIFFNAKRKQRIIPEITPVRNTTVDFTKTIGNLYYQEGNHHTIIDKKIIYFLERIRNEYMLDTYSLDDDFTEKLHLKTGRPVADIQKTITLIKKHRHQFESTEADVIEINKAIEKLML